MNIITEKNFLNKKDFNELKKEVINSPFYFSPDVSEHKKNDGYYFTHEIFGDCQIFSIKIFKLILPVLKKLKVKALYKAKVNLYPSTHKILEHGQHVVFYLIVMCHTIALLVLMKA